MKKGTEDHVEKQKEEKETSESKRKDAEDKVEKSRKLDAKVKNKTRKKRMSSDEDDEMTEKDEAKSGRRYERVKSTDRSDNQVPRSHLETSGETELNENDRFFFHFCTIFSKASALLFCCGGLLISLQMDFKLAYDKYPLRPSNNGTCQSISVINKNAFQ